MLEILCKITRIPNLPIVLPRIGFHAAYNPLPVHRHRNLPMDPETLFAKLAHILDEDSIDGDYVLRSSLVWDSLSVLAIVSFVDECCDSPLHLSDLHTLHTAGDLLRFLNSRNPVADTTPGG